jgi:hypothetical protein
MRFVLALTMLTAFAGPAAAQNARGFTPGNGDASCAVPASISATSMSSNTPWRGCGGISGRSIGARRPPWFPSRRTTPRRPAAFRPRARTATARCGGCCTDAARYVAAGQPISPRYRALTDQEKALHDEIKAKATELEALFSKVPAGRYGALAMTALEQSVMWIVKELTA